MAAPDRSHAGLLLAATLVACGGEFGASGGENADDLPLLELEEELRLGSVDDPDAGFSRIAGVTVDAGGNIYVLEAQDREVRVFDPDGNRLRTFGGQGAGPGEFSMPERIGFKDDTLWVMDHRPPRITMFSREGAVLTTFPAPVLFDLTYPTVGIEGRAFPGPLRADGFVGMGDLSVSAYLDFITSPPPDSLDVPIVRFDREANVVDTVGQQRVYLRDRIRDADALRARGIVVSASLVPDPGPPADTPLRVILEDGMILVDRRIPSTSDDASFSVTRTRLDGDTVYHRRFTYEPRAIGPALADTIRSRRGDIELPDLQAPISQARLGQDGALWLRREDTDGPTFEWLILEPDGTPRGQLELPRGLRIRWTGSDVLYAEQRDSLDVPWLLRFRITWLLGDRTAAGGPCSFRGHDGFAGSPGFRARRTAGHGCADATPRTQATVRDSAGIRIVENDPADSARLERWTLAESPALDIGVAEGDEAEMLFRVTDAARLSDGRVAIATATDVRYFSAEGDHIRTVGRDGSGPGEFRLLSRLLRGGQDTLLALDERPRRVSVLDPDGNYVRDLGSAIAQVFRGMEGRYPDGALVDLVPGLERDSLSVEHVRFYRTHGN